MHVRRVLELLLCATKISSYRCHHHHHDQSIFIIQLTANTIWSCPPPLASPTPLQLVIVFWMTYHRHKPSQYDTCGVRGIKPSRHSNSQPQSFSVNFIFADHKYLISPSGQFYFYSLLVDGDLDCCGVMVRNVSQYANDCARLLL